MTQIKLVSYKSEIYEETFYALTSDKGSATISKIISNGEYESCSVIGQETINKQHDSLDDAIKHILVIL